MLIAAAAIAALAGGSAVARTPPATAPTPALKADPELSLHDRCKIFMGNRMDPRWMHDHHRDKTGMPTWPRGRPPTKAQMDAMHKQCLKLMSEKAPAAPPK